MTHAPSGSGQRYDAIVIGAGVNGLVTAALLGRAGRRVLVLERRTATEGTPDTGWIPPRVVRDLQLGSQGLRVWHPDPWVAATLPDGGRLELPCDMARSVEAIGRVSPADACKWPEFCARMGRLARVLEALYAAPAPDVMTRHLGELAHLAGLGWQVRRQGKQAVGDLLRTLPMSVADLLDEWFESDALKGLVGAAGITDMCQGPRSGGTAFLALHQHVGSPEGVFRPPLSNIGEVLGRVPTRGVEVRRGAEVTGITARAERVTGVVLAGGDEIGAPVVVSSADPRRTLLGLVEPGSFDPEFVRAVGNIRCRGVTAHVTLTFDRAPGFSTLAVAPSLEYLERAYDDAKYGRISAKPYVEARAEAAESGGHRVLARVQYAPYALSEGAWDDARRRALGDLVVTTLAESVPALRGAAAQVVVRTPKDLEDEQGLTGGHVHHGELGLDQVLFMRPVAGWSRYRTPLEGLYLGGAGTHPGGGVAGGPGYHAARAVLKDGRDGSDS